jgi:hypothetical protein
MAGKTALSIVACVLLVAVATIALPETVDPRTLTVHEWGTFTSIAGENGEAMPWRTYGGSSDLPCFVNRFDGFKGGVQGTVRMETPVLYFYSPSALLAHVRVGFPKGTVTEWYPKAILDRSYTAVEWRNVGVSPNGAADFPRDGSSHYYAARETDAAPLQVGSQKEKFLFYRGVGTFPVPLSSVVTADGKISVKNSGSDPVPAVILFENRAGKQRYRFAGALQTELSLDSESLPENSGDLFRDLQRLLVDRGLYQREARAMIETWRDSWFEEGTRLFYIVPPRAVDAILPLEIQPTPLQVSRVFVGRMELITPALVDTVREAVARGDRRALAKYGRFLAPIAKRAGLKSAVVDAAYANYLGNTANCVQ